MKKYTSIILIAIISLAFASCKSSKNVSYFQNADKVTINLDKNDYSLKLQPQDKLQITISSLIPSATDAYRIIPAPTDGNDFNPMVNYTVDEKGNIEIPTLGEIKVTGMTATELKEYIEKEVSKAVADPIIIVKLSSFRVNILGEVRNPGAKQATSEKYSILDAIADAGDVTLYGIKTNVMLIREENGTKQFHTLDLTDANLINSPYFYLKQNDVIYVQPDKVRVVNSEFNQNNSFKLSIATAVISAVSVIASLVIALAINK